MRTLKKIVIGVIVYWLSFVTVMIVLFCVKDSVPDTLIQFALGGGAVELIVTALIEIFKSYWEKIDERNNVRSSDTDHSAGSSADCLDLDSEIAKYVKGQAGQ